MVKHSEHIKIGNTYYKLLLADNFIVVSPSSESATNALIIGCMSNIKVALGMKLEDMKKLLYSTTMQVAFKRGAVSPSNKRATFNSLCLMPSEEDGADGEIIEVASLLAYNGVIKGIQFNQALANSEKLSGKQKVLSIQHKLTLGNDPSNWTTERAESAISTIMKAPRSELTSVKTKNSIKVTNNVYGVTYTFYIDSRKFMNLLSIISLK